MNFLPGLISGFLAAVTAFPLKEIMKNAEALPSLFYNDFLIVLVLLPFINPSHIITSFSWTALFAGIVWLVFSIVLFYSYDKVDASSRIVFGGFQPIFAVLFAVLLLHELFSLNLGISIALGLIASFILYKGSKNGMITRKGLILSFATCVFGALTGSFDKMLSAQFGFVNYLFYIALFVGFSALIFSLILKKNLINGLKKTWYWIIFSALSGVVLFFINLWSYNEIGVSYTNLLFLTGIPWAILIGYFFFGEKSYLKEKIIAFIIIVLSVVILSV